MAIQLNDNIKINAGKPSESKYLNGVSAYASTSAVNTAIPISERYLGLTVLIGADEYWYKNGITDPDLILKSSGGGGGGFSLPIVRYVYLVNDSSDQTLMGGTASEVYTTFQAAYDRAVVIQTALGGSLKVGIKVGNTVAATVGGVTLSANWNSNIIIIGESNTTSLLGTVSGNNTTNGFTVNITAFNCNISTITSQSTSAGNGGAITINGSFICGNISSQSLGSSGNGGAVTLNGINGVGSCGQVNTASANGNGGNITATNGYRIGSISMVNTLGNSGALSLTNSFCGTITITHTGTANSSFTLNGCVVGNITINCNSTGSTGGVNPVINNTIGAAFTFNENSVSNNRTIIFTLCNFGSIVSSISASSIVAMDYTIDYSNFTSSIALTNNYTGSTLGTGFTVNSSGSKCTFLSHVGNNTGKIQASVNLYEFTTTSNSQGVNIFTGSNITSGTTGSSIGATLRNVNTREIELSNIDGFSSIYMDNSANYNICTFNLGDSDSATNGPSKIELYNNRGLSLTLNSSGLTGEVKDLFLKNCIDSSVDHTSISNNEILGVSVKNSQLNYFNNSSTGTINSIDFISKSVDYDFIIEDIYYAVEFISVDTSSATRVVNLPTAFNNFNRQIGVKKTSASNSITININGSAFDTMTSIGTNIYKSNGINWILIS